MLVNEETDVTDFSSTGHSHEMHDQIQQLRSEVALLTRDNEQKSLWMKEIQNILTDIQTRTRSPSTRQVTFQVNRQNEQLNPISKAVVALMKREFMEKIGKIREQIKSDINDVRLANVDKGGLLETQVHDLQHRIETLTCDVKLRFKQVDDLLKQMQSNQAKNRHELSLNIAALSGAFYVNK